MKTENEIQQEQIRNAQAALDRAEVEIRVARKVLKADLKVLKARKALAIALELQRGIKLPSLSHS